MKHLAYLSLGTNLGDKEQNIHTAMQLIRGQIGHIAAHSALYHTRPWGFESENGFLNNALAVETHLSPHLLLEATQRIEVAMGRTHKSVNRQYTDRLIDIDILFYDRLVMQSPTLTLPHPLLHQRDFVLRPLHEIAPDLIHPLLGKSIHTLLQELPQ